MAKLTKKEERAKKSQELKDLIDGLNIFYKIENETDEYVEYNIDILNHLIKAYQRNRFSGGHAYDPLSNYKKLVRNIITPMIKKDIPNPLKGYVYIEMDLYFKIPKAFSLKQQKYAMDGILRPAIQKDNDNIEKTAFDLINGIVYEDDGQIIENITKKYYAEEERTVIRLKIYKDELIVSGRLNKEEIKGMNK